MCHLDIEGENIMVLCSAGDYLYYSSFSSRFGGYIMMRSIFRRKKGVESYFAKLSSNFLLTRHSIRRSQVVGHGKLPA